MYSFEKIITQKWLVVISYVTLSLIVFGIVLSGGFVFDDTLFVESNTAIRSLTNIFEFFVTSPVTGAGLDVSNFYRPLQTLIFALVYSVFGLTPFVFHLIPLVLHTINALFVRRLLIHLNFSDLSAYIGGIFFLLHPAQLEAVSYISGLADPLTLFFFFLGFFAFLKNQWRSILWCVLALLSKEWAVLFLPFILILSSTTWKNIPPPTLFFRKIFITLSTFLTSIYLVLKFTVLDFTGLGGLAENVPHLGVRLITFVATLWEYALILFFPLTLYLERPYEYISQVVHPQFIFGILLIMLVFFISIYAYKKDQRVALGFSFMSVAFIPYTNIVPLNAIYLEHWLYIPLIGFIIVLSSLLEKIKNKKIVVIGFLIIILLFTVRDIQRNIDWTNTERFYLHEIAHNPTARIHNNLAMYYAEKSNYQDAIDHYKKSLAIDRSFPQTYHNLGQTYRALKRFEEAETMYKEALLLNHQFIHSYIALYNLYIEVGETEKAEEILFIINSAR